MMMDFAGVKGDGLRPWDAQVNSFIENEMNFRLRMMNFALKMMNTHASPPSNLDFLLKNLDFLLKNPDFLLKNLDFLLKNPDFMYKQGGAYWRLRGRDSGSCRRCDPQVNSRSM